LIDVSTKLDLECLRSFVAIADSMNFTKAAFKVGRSQSAISMQMKRLEQAVGGKLFERKLGSLTLTPRGDALRPRALQLLKSSDELLEQLQSFDLSGRVKLGVCDDFAEGLLEHVLGRFRRVHTKIALELTVNLSVRLLDGLDRGEFDLVVAKRTQAGPGRQSRLLTQTKLIWISSDHLQTKISDPLPLVLFPEGSFPRDMMLASLARAGRSWFLAATCHSLAGLKASVAAGLGISAITHTAIGQGLRALDHADLPALPDIETALFWPEVPLSQAAHRLRKAIESSVPIPV
jgi:DNA-binding transcriptional LysR family regulator